MRWVSSVAGKLDLGVLFSALHGELNARVIARTTINVAHLQSILIFSGGFILTDDSGLKLGGSGQSLLQYAFSSVIPLISFYFVSLYRHNELQIGTLTRHLRLIESTGDIAEPLRFYPARSRGGIDSRAAWSISHRSIILLCCTSPALILLERAFDAIYEQPAVAQFDGSTALFFGFSFLVSAANVHALMKLRRTRDPLADDRPEEVAQ